MRRALTIKLKFLSFQGKECLKGTDTVWVQCIDCNGFFRNEECFSHKSYP